MIDIKEDDLQNFEGMQILNMKWSTKNWRMAEFGFNSKSCVVMTYVTRISVFVGPGLL